VTRNGSTPPPTLRVLRACLALLAFSGGLCLAPLSALAKPCDAADNVSWVTGAEECLVIRTFRSAGELSDPTLVVVLHGDVSSGGPANYHFAFAQKLADAPAQNLVAVAMVRPGYPDGAGNTSTGDTFDRQDHYTPENIDAVAGAIRHLKEHYQASRIVLVGHSGGAATSGVILGRHPGLATAAILVSCPCIISKWRESRARQSPWLRSESPHDWVNKVPETSRVVALTGTDDTNTRPALADEYVELLRKRGIDARFIAVPRASHNSAFRSAQVEAAVASLLR
jgi:pimeloyl-ACP methyl ester carboxylesterase